MEGFKSFLMFHTGMGYFILFWIHCLTATCVIANGIKFHYHVSEGKARFMQEIETDLEKDTVKYHTPAHNDVLESYKLQDFNKGLQMTCFPSTRECRIRDIDRDIHSSAGNVSEAYIHSWNKGDNSIQVEYTTLIEERYYVEKEILSTAFLGQELHDFFNSFGFRLLKEARIPANATLHPIVKGNAKGRKRSHSIVDFDCGTATPRLKYGFTSGRTCHYMKVCGARALSLGRDNIILENCEDRHITAKIAYKCLCCPPIHSVINMDDTKNNDCTALE